MDFSTIPFALEGYNLQNMNPYSCMGAIKVMIQTHGVCLSGINTPANSDGAGIYLILRDDLLKIDVPVYAHRSDCGYLITERRSTINVHGRPIRLEFERPYYSFDTEIDGVPFRDVCNIEYDGHLALTANHGCLYFKDGTPCSFCAIPQWRDAGDRSIKRLIDASAYAIAAGEVRHLSITTGTGSGSDRGIRSILNVLARLGQRIQLAQIPIFAEFEPPEDLNWIDELRGAGVTTISCNLEFLRADRRLKYMPGKGVIPFERFLRVWERSVKLFGRGQVFSNVLMTEDHVSVHDRMASEELSAMIDIGVIPSPGPLYPDPASVMANAGIPTVFDQIEFLELVVKQLYQHNLNPRLALAGCHRNGAYSAVNQFYAAHASGAGLVDHFATA